MKKIGHKALPGKAGLAGGRAYLKLVPCSPSSFQEQRSPGAGADRHSPGRLKHTSVTPEVQWDTAFIKISSPVSSFFWNLRCGHILCYLSLAEDSHRHRMIPELCEQLIWGRDWPLPMYGTEILRTEKFTQVAKCFSTLTCNNYKMFEVLYSLFKFISANWTHPMTKTPVLALWSSTSIKQGLQFSENKGLGFHPLLCHQFSKSSWTRYVSAFCIIIT